MVCTTLPVTVIGAALPLLPELAVFGRPLLVAGLVPGLGEWAGAAGVMAGGGGSPAEVLRVLKDSSRTRHAAVVTIARMTRPIWMVTSHSSKDSWWMRRRGTPASRSERMTVRAMPGGPHT